MIFMRLEFSVLTIFASVLIAALTIFMPSVAHAQGAACAVNITGFNGTYYIPGSSTCTTAYVNVSQNSAQNRIVCNGNSAQIKGVTFGNGSFNNTLFNCTFSSADIVSLVMAENNLISPYGSYTMSFADNKSNIAIGYYFTFISKNYVGKPSTALYITVVPYVLAEAASNFINSQNLALDVIRSQAELINYTLPRFGYYASVNSTGIMHFALEKEQVYRNRTINFNPYWFVTPYWGWDELSYKEFNITSDMNYTPTLVYPTMQENVRFPDNTTIYWNYTIIKYSNASNMTLYIDRGWQGDQNNSLAYVQHNVTNSSISYKVGRQAPGIYEYIAILKSPQAHEHDNSTTETYGIGLPYCQIGDASQILFPGYYSMPYKNLNMLNTFWVNGSLCNVPINVVANNVTIDCRGGNINSNNVSIEISGASNTKVENCNVYGNGFRINNADMVNITNTNVISDKPGNIAFNVSGSANVIISNVSVVGYGASDRVLNVSSMISMQGVSFSNETRNITQGYADNNATAANYTNSTGADTSSAGNSTIVFTTPSKHAAPQQDYYLIIALAVVVGACTVIYRIASGILERRR